MNLSIRMQNHQIEESYCAFSAHCNTKLDFIKDEIKLKSTTVSQKSTHTSPMMFEANSTRSSVLKTTPTYIPVHAIWKGMIGSHESAVFLSATSFIVPSDFRRSHISACEASDINFWAINFLPMIRSLINLEASCAMRMALQSLQVQSVMD